MSDELTRVSFPSHSCLFLQEDAYSFATVSLFGGILFYKGIDLIVHMIDGSAGDHNVDIDLYDLDGSSNGNSPATAPVKGNRSGKRSTEGANSSASAITGTAVVNRNETDIEKPPSNAGTGRNGSSHAQFPHQHDVVVELNSGNPTVRPSPDLHTLHLRMAGKVQHPAISPAAIPTPSNPKAENAPDVEDGEARVTAGEDALPNTVGDDKLVRMGVMTAVAIGIHNFPEGLATFVAALSDPSVGAALAVAIAIHNIPEGLCVAIPVYYATGNRWKAFGWALLSGVSEPIGAGLGWIVLKDNMSETVYGILFGVVAGMMINITIHELIPTAVRYDPADKITTNSIIVGMAIMALSLLMFLY